MVAEPELIVRFNMMVSVYGPCSEVRIVRLLLSGSNIVQSKATYCAAVEYLGKTEIRGKQENGKPKFSFTSIRREHELYASYSMLMI